MHPKNVKQNKQHIASLENNLEAGDVSLWMPGSLFHERLAADLTFTIMLFLTKNKKQLIKVQVAYEPSAPLNFSTPFCENRYHKIADLAEWCFFFCDIFLKYKDLTQLYLISFVFYEKVTAFAYTIRAPPSEI